jgi:5-methylcytosine-specific restriction endonuclease McrA
MTKTCKKCLQNKELSEFYKHTQKGKNGQVWDYYNSYCKFCRLEYSANRSVSVKQQAIDYLGGKCVDCGLVDDPCVYDFHHLDPSKKDFSFGKRGGISLEKMKPELDKCVLLCSNCHRKKHAKKLKLGD